MTNIVIVGAGYAGVMAGLGLYKKLKHDKNVSITLVDRHDYQLFTSNLYEVASAEEELTTISQLKKSIAVPLKEIFENTNVKIVQADVSSIDRHQRVVTAGISKIPYDYLVLATGSETDYFGIEGAQQYSLPMKSLKDALGIRNKLEFSIQAHRADMNKKNLRVVVAGGGYTGVELAGELGNEIQFLAWKNQYPLEKIEVTIVEAMQELIPGLSPRMSQDSLWRLKDHRVRVELSSPIHKVDEHFVELQNGERMEYDVLVWTTGVRAKPLPFVQPVETDKKGRIITNEFLQAKDDEHVFAGGDIACVLNVDGKPAPPTAQDSIEHGIYIGHALSSTLANRKPAAYQGKKHGFIVAVGGMWHIMDYAGIYLTGFPAFFVRQLANINYFRKIVGWWKAVWYIVFQTKIYSRND